MYKLKHLLSGICLVVPSIGFAGGDSGLYLGFGAGQYSSEIDQSEIASIGASEKFKASSTTGKVIAGFNFGILPLIDLAVEGNYVLFQQTEKDDIKVDGNSANIFGLAGFNLGPVGLFGKVGYANWELKAQSNGSENLSGSDPVYGIGARFQIFGISVRGEYEYYDISNANLSTVTASLIYTF